MQVSINHVNGKQFDQELIMLIVTNAVKHWINEKFLMCLKVLYILSQTKHIIMIMLQWNPG